MTSKNKCKNTSRSYDSLHLLRMTSINNCKNKCRSFDFAQDDEHKHEHNEGASLAA